MELLALLIASVCICVGIGGLVWIVGRYLLERSDREFRRKHERRASP
jgi:hypothetical protein